MTPGRVPITTGSAVADFRQPITRYMTAEIDRPRKNIVARRKGNGTPMQGHFSQWILCCGISAYW